MIVMSLNSPSDLDTVSVAPVVPWVPVPIAGHVLEFQPENFGGCSSNVIAARFRTARSRVAEIVSCGPKIGRIPAPMVGDIARGCKSVMVRSGTDVNRLVASARHELDESEDMLLSRRTRSVRGRSKHDLADFLD